MNGLVNVHVEDLLIAFHDNTVLALGVHLVQDVHWGTPNLHDGSNAI